MSAIPQYAFHQYPPQKQVGTGPQTNVDKTDKNQVYPQQHFAHRNENCASALLFESRYLLLNVFLDNLQHGSYLSGAIFDVTFMDFIRISFFASLCLRSYKNVGSSQNVALDIISCYDTTKLSSRVICLRRIG